jgi:L-ascorbate metabolism protein UlaG (beta-lactamase superfamily)
MKIRFLGHSCIEIIGYRHIVIDPDFTTEPEPGVEYICVTHGHQDHIGRLAEIPTGVMVASPDVCQMGCRWEYHNTV